MVCMTLSTEILLLILQLMEMATVSRLPIANIWGTSPRSSCVTCTLHIGFLPPALLCWMLYGDVLCTRSYILGLVQLRTRGMCSSYASFTWTWHVSVAIDIIWGITMNIKFSGAWLSARHLVSLSTCLQNWFQLDDRIHFSGGSRRSFWSILYRHGFSSVMGGRCGQMEAVKMNGSGGEYGGISKGNEVSIVTWSAYRALRCR